MTIASASDHDARIASLITGRLPAERAVEQLAERDAVPAIAAALVSEGISAGVDPAAHAFDGWRAALARSLARIGDPRAENVLVALLEGGDPLERADAALALESCRRAEPAREGHFEPSRTPEPLPVGQLAARPLPA